MRPVSHMSCSLAACFAHWRAVAVEKARLTAAQRVAAEAHRRQAAQPDYQAHIFIGRCLRSVRGYAEPAWRIAALRL